YHGITEIDSEGGSYGILCIHDDEDERGFDNDFRVHVLSRGIIVEKADPFLSPFILTVEDVFSTD
ncbi:MAG TPA: Imm7 family immunity protein, partial [Pseudobacteroides sp.]|uniref:Imm7 family immunity protein n=1 Tax=Pseudobacteroides sp. TaxID=1968840 RepID=UPI002F95D0DB